MSTSGGKKGVVAIRPARARKLVVPSAAYDRVVKELDARGLLVKGPSGVSTRQIQIKDLDERARYLCVRMGKKG